MESWPEGSLSKDNPTTQDPVCLCICGGRKPKSITLTWLKKAVEDRKLFDSSRLKRCLKRKRDAANHGRAAGGGSRADNRTGWSKVLCDPGFPLYYVLRNLWWLKSEGWWRALSPRARRVHAFRMVSERIVMFNEVKNWRKNRKTGGNADCALSLPGPQGPAAGGAEHIPEFNRGDMNTPGYCNKCGLCCEVASGMPDFPAPEALPGRWREVFANGLGPGHRFCPFLWEDNSSGGGFCSIYPLRSNPCRLFGSEECEFFWKSSEPVELSSRKKILLMGRWLTGLVNPRKLPPASTETAAKRPKFLEFDRLKLVPLNDLSTAVVNRVVQQVRRK